MNNLNSILDYLKVFNNINKRPAYKPRTMAQEPRNRYSQGQLVRNTVDGSRPGYQGPDKYVTPLRRKFDGQKFISVDDPTYSDGRKRVKTKAYEKWLKKEHTKPKPKFLYERTIRDELDRYLVEIAEALQKADNTQDFEYLMRDPKASKQLEIEQTKSREARGLKTYKQRVYKKGMLNKNALKVVEKLEQDPVSLKIIAESLGEDTDWVLDRLDERNQYVEDVKRERATAKKDPRYIKPRNDYLKVENWVQKNAQRYANPETFEKALIKRFGNKNQFVMDMKKGGSISSTYFSDGFKKLMLNSDPGSPVKSHHLKQLIKSSLYNFNPKIKKDVTNEIKGIFNSENLPKIRTEARKLLNNNKLLAKFGLNKAITGPYAKVIQAEIGKQLWDNINNFRQHRVGTYEMLKAFEDIVPPEFKGMFKESAKAILHSQQQQWKQAKDVFGIADKIAWDHKVPSSIIDKGYADIVEYTKVNPTTAHFNERIKNAEFDRKINKLVKKYEGVTTLDQKVGIVEEMNKVKSDFNTKYGGYLEDVNIKLDEKGNLRFSSTGKPLTTKMDRVKMLETSLQQEKFPTMNKKQQAKLLQNLGYGKGCKASGGRVGFKDAGDVGAGQMKCIMSDVEKTRADMKSPNVEVRAMARTKQRNALKLASKIPQIGKIIKTGIQLGTAAITKPLQWLGLTSGIGYAIEGIVEGGFYDNARRKGYSHEQAMAETLTPGLIAGRPHDVPWYGGAEKLREKELYEIKGRNEFIDVENRPPMQDPEFEKVIGTHGKVKQYVDALKEQDRIYDVIGAKEQAKHEAGLAETGFDATLLSGDLDAASADVQDLARSGAYRRVDRTLAPESMASQAYNTAVEKRDALDQRRRTEYLEKYDPRALDHEQKSFDIYARDKEGKILYEKPRSLYKKRYEEMDEMFPDYNKEDIDYILKNMYGTSMKELGEGYTYKNIGKWFKDKDKSSYFADNFRMEKAQGGIMNLKTKW